MESKRVEVSGRWNRWRSTWEASFKPCHKQTTTWIRSIWKMFCMEVPPQHFIYISFGAQTHYYHFSSTQELNSFEVRKMACFCDRRCLFRVLQILFIMITIFVASPDSGVGCSRPLLLRPQWWREEEGLVLQSLRGPAPPSTGSPVH